MYNYRFSKEKFKTWLFLEANNKGIIIEGHHLERFADWYAEHLAEVDKCLPEDDVVRDNRRYDLKSHASASIQLIYCYSLANIQIKIASSDDVLLLTVNESYASFIDVKNEGFFTIPKRSSTIGTLIRDLVQTYDRLKTPQTTIENAITALLNNGKKATFENHNGKEVTLSRVKEEVTLQDADLVLRRTFKLPEPYWLMGANPTLEMYLTSPSFDYRSYEGEGVEYPNKYKLDQPDYHKTKSFGCVIELIKEIKKEFQLKEEAIPLLKTLYRKGKYESIEFRVKAEVESEIQPVIHIHRTGINTRIKHRHYIIDNPRVITDIGALE